MDKKMKEKLTHYRKKANLTQKQMAEKLGISESYYCQLENGNRRMSLNMALDISAILCVNPNEIFFAKDFAKCNEEKCS